MGVSFWGGLYATEKTDRNAGKLNGYKVRSAMRLCVLCVNSNLNESPPEPHQQMFIALTEKGRFNHLSTLLPSSSSLAIIILASSVSFSAVDAASTGRLSSCDLFKKFLSGKDQTRSSSSVYRVIITLRDPIQFWPCRVK